MPRIAALIEFLRHHRLLPLLMLALGVLTPFAFSPFDLWPLALVGIGLAGELLRGHAVKRTAWLAWCYGFGLWAYGTHWLYVSIHDYGYTPPWLATPMVGALAGFMALFFALLGFLYARFRLDRHGLLTLTALWVLGEWIRSWLLTGFPWLFTGYAFIDTPLAGYAPLFGVFGISLIAVFSALAVFRGMAEPKAWPALAVAAVLWAGGFALQGVQWTRPTGEQLSVSIVQGNIPQEVKWQLEWRDRTVDIYRQLSKSEWGRDLVIWPEAAVPMFYHEAVDAMTEMQDSALAGHSAFVTGIPYIEVDDAAREYRIYNSILALGEGGGIYHKQRLVPFGEYIPLETWLRGAIPFFDMPMTSFTEGSDRQAPLQVQKMTLGPMICYEIAYPDLVRRLAAASDVLATISNDGWFGGSIGPHQHFQMVRMRAVENGREVIRATNNGISAIIDARGQVRERAPQFQRLVLRTSVNGYRGLTPYMVMGNWPALLACALLLAVGARRRALLPAGASPSPALPPGPE
ncbi:MAG: apolipoprotein N-acyltransferase [Moraxellaceae bacterium]|jgi:apolipoprotein N-acyltransferase|nr:apolipoprotein N-acyltransferase [Moraxellaceae bacterium]